MSEVDGSRHEAIYLKAKCLAYLNRDEVACKYVKGTRKALKEIEQIPHVPVRIVMLDYTATHCGIREIATRAFDLPCEGIESHSLFDTL